MSDIAERVKQIIMDKLDLEDETEISEESSFVDDLGADSLDTVEMIMDLEDEFDIEIPDEDAEKIVTVGDAIAYIQEKVATKGQ